MAWPARRLQFLQQAPCKALGSNLSSLLEYPMTAFIFKATSTRRYILMLTAVAAYFAAGHAAADSNSIDDVPRVVVSLAGLDLSTPKGADLVYGRIRSAAEFVCSVNQSREPARIARARVCFRNAIDDAIAQANRPLLSELHARRMGNPREVIQSANLSGGADQVGLRRN
jgi:UrcA family protein